MKKEKIRNELQRALVVFADIWGFGKWSRRVNPKEYRLLKDAYDKQLDLFRIQSRGYFKAMGDGFMVIYPMPNLRNADCVSKIINHLRLHYHDVKKTIDNYPYYPRPHGYRVRMSLGHIWYRSGPNHDYSGYFVNMTSHLLSIEKDIPFIIHQSVREALSDKQINKHQYHFAKVQPPSFYSDGIDQDDIENLWSLEMP